MPGLEKLLIFETKTMNQVFNHRTRVVGPEVQARINALGIGQKMQDLPEELWHPSFRFYVKEDPTRRGGPNLRIIRLDPEKPSLTVTGYIFNKFVHPFEDRFITPREAARLQGFPDDIEFIGSLSSTQQQVGDAVPIELGRAVFSSLLAQLQCHYPNRQVFPALSLFSGAGGLDIAAKTATNQGIGCWNTFAAVEIDPDRCATLEGYFPDALKVFNNDIREVNTDFILRSCGLNASDVWLVYGGPPCQTFSQAGKQKGTYDPRGTLIFQFLRFVEEISPPFFLMENVRNLKAIDQGRLLKTIQSEMRKHYHVECKLLNAADYGSAQLRNRLIFLGTRKDLPIRAYLPHPTHGEISNLFGTKPYKTVGEAFAGLPSPSNFKNHPTESFDDLISASQTTLDFWDNPFDDEDWNEYGLP
jgi:DNA (cytosine-5)-methyltransferase 1